ncbi:MAG: hypothetical protein QXP53_00005, partial [Candidatus Pacearchaeota archaeon]
MKKDKFQIYSKRPFNCVIFPFDIRRINGKLCWVLLDFCFRPENIEQNLKEFEKTLSQIDHEELNLYMDYTCATKDLKNVKFKILREVKTNRVNVEILHHKNYRFMFIDGHSWMWDTPQERKLQENLAKKAFGNVLIAGYGPGILPKFLIKNPKVKSITIVEKYHEVIEKIRELDKI